jgi:hypothetical protein
MTRGRRVSCRRFFGGPVAMGTNQHRPMRFVLLAPRIAIAPLVSQSQCRWRRVLGGSALGLVVLVLADLQVAHVDYNAQASRRVVRLDCVPQRWRHQAIRKTVCFLVSRHGRSASASFIPMLCDSRVLQGRLKARRRPRHRQVGRERDRVVVIPLQQRHAHAAAGDDVVLVVGCVSPCLLCRLRSLPRGDGR